jgi:hypothetical protein
MVVAEVWEAMAVRMIHPPRRLIKGRFNHRHRHQTFILVENMNPRDLFTIPYQSFQKPQKIQP